MIMESYVTKNHDLFVKLKSGDKTARDRILEENIGLVRKVVSSFQRYENISEDLIQIGAIGLLKAIDNFDLSYNVQFSTYAVPMILGEIRRFLRDDGIIKVSRKMKQDAYKGYKARETLIKKLMREPTIKEISAESKISVEELMQAFDSARETESINSKMFEDSDCDMSEKISDNYDEERVVNKILVDEILKKLPEREREILVLRYFHGKTQEEISRVVGVSQVQVSRIEKSVLKKIRETELSDT